MEVHHHPNVEKKNFKEYFLEFLMIFLAVTMGFFAESIREHVTDNAKEKEYILSMIEDAEKDTSNMSHAILLNEIRINQLDSLANLCINYNPEKNDDAEMYRHYRFGLVHPAFISPTERTIQQLKNAGGMRLIRKKSAVDSIIQYDDIAKKLADQQAYYELYQNKSMELGVKLFNFQRFGFGIGTFGLRILKDKDSLIKLRMNDKAMLSEFGNDILIYEGVVNFYNTRLKEMNNHATTLIAALRKEYHFENGE
jgi:hypothetical protein